MSLVDKLSVFLREITLETEKMVREESGFTLIELLVVVTIIGIIAAIAIPQFEQYRTRAFDARAVSDMKNIISAQEAYFSDSETFVDDLSNLTGFDVNSPAVSVILDASSGSWSGSTYHPQGTTTYCYNSGNNNGIVEVSGINMACP